MEIFEIEFKGKRLRAYESDISQVFFSFEDLRPIVGAGDPFKDFGAEFLTIPEEDKEVLAVCEFEILSRPVFRASCPDFWDWFVGDGLREIRIHVANFNFENGLGDKSAHTPAFAELSANFERMKNKVEEERRFNAALLDQVVKLAKRVGELSTKLEGV